MVKVAEVKTGALILGIGYVGAVKSGLEPYHFKSNDEEIGEADEVYCIKWSQGCQMIIYTYTKEYIGEAVFWLFEHKITIEIKDINSNLCYFPDQPKHLLNARNLERKKREYEKAGIPKAFNISESFFAPFSYPTNLLAI